MLTEETIRTIEWERSTAIDAMEKGNVGKARVCCRRAVGALLDNFAMFRNTARAPHAMAWLERLSLDSTMPEEVRSAAFRLRSKRNEAGDMPVSTEPLRDFDIIESHILSLIQT